MEDLVHEDSKSRDEKVNEKVYISIASITMRL